MNELKNVLKRLQDEEVKLSSENVELGLLQDFEGANKKAIGSGASVGDELNDIIKRVSSVETSIKSSIKDQQKAIDLGEKMISASKDLGLDVPKSVSKGVEGAKQWEKELKSFLSVVSKIKF